MGPRRKKLWVDEVTGVGPWPNKTSILIRRGSRELTLSFHVHIKRRPCEDTARRQPAMTQEVPFPDTESVGTWILGFLASIN